MSQLNYVIHKDEKGNKVMLFLFQSFVDACLDIPMTQLLRQLHIDWSIYQV